MRRPGGSGGEAPEALPELTEAPGADAEGLPSVDRGFVDVAAACVRHHGPLTVLWSAAKEVIPPWFDFYLGLEEGAVSIECYDALTVTGLLQCRAYAQVLLRGHGSALPDEEVARRVDLRLGRQAVLDRLEDPLRLWAVLDESVLHRMIGGPEVMAVQLDHLLKLAERPEIQLQVLPAVLPATHGVHPALHGSFRRMTFPTPGDPGLVYLESWLGGSYHEAQQEIDAYTEIMNHLRVLALTPEHSTELIHHHRKNLL